MASNRPNIQKFHFGELFNDSKGKTSIGLVCGALMILTGCVGFLLGILYSQELVIPSVLTTALGFCSLGGALLGIRRFTKDKDIITLDNTEEKKEDNKVS